MNNFLKIFLAAALAILLALLADPFMAWMPPAGAMAMLLAAATLLAVWAGLVLYERGGDERERNHRLIAGRAAYLSGLAILTIALVAQGLRHDVDPWICLALAAMVIVKLAARLFLERHR